MRERELSCVIFSGEKTGPHMRGLSTSLPQSFGGTSQVGYRWGHGGSVQHHLDDYTCQMSEGFFVVAIGVCNVLMWKHRGRELMLLQN